VEITIEKPIGVAGVPAADISVTVAGLDKSCPEAGVDCRRIGAAVIALTSPVPGVEAISGVRHVTIRVPAPAPRSNPEIVVSNRPVPGDRKAIKVPGGGIRPHPRSLTPLITRIRRIRQIEAVRPVRPPDKGVNPEPAIHHPRLARDNEA